MQLFTHIYQLKLIPPTGISLCFSIAVLLFTPTFIVLTLQPQTVIRPFNVVSWNGIRVKVRVEKCSDVIEVRVEKCSIASKVRVEKCSIASKVRVEKCGVVAKVRVEKCIFALFLCYKSILNYQRNQKSYAIWKEKS